ncbi:hypothetical protein JTB14_000330 [Gonioctena quinquepunctata]|nr:hypothetical protein JTB14_000330 [Gonioctena quinquepunctata]
MRKRGDEESLHPAMSDESIEYVGTFSSYYQKSVPGTSSATENDGVPKKRECSGKWQYFCEVGEVPETISTPMVEEDSNLSMDYRENLEKDEQSIKEDNIYKH